MATTNAGAIGVLVEADTASFDSSMSKVGAAAEREMKRVERAQGAAKVEGDRFVTMLQKQVDTFGLTGTALLAYEAKLKGVSTQAQPLIDKLNAMKVAQQELNRQGGNGLTNVSKGMKDAANAADGAAHGTSGITRELLVLAHEASQGNFKRFGGSMLVLAEYSTKAQAALHALFGPIGLVVGAIGLLGLAAFEGAKQADELRKSLILTGNFAGTTASQFELLAKTVASSTSTTVGKAASALQALVSTGEIGPKLLGDMAAATVKLESLTGKSAEEIAKDFAKMQEAPTKWAAEANKAYNFLSVAQYDHIKRLEEEGKREQASIEVLDRLNEHLGTRIPQSLTWLGTALHETGLAWDKFWHAAVHEGAPETVQDKIDTLDKKLAFMRSVRDDHSLLVTDVGAGGPAAMADLVEQRRALQGVARDEKDLALATAARLKAQKDGIAASDYFTKLQEERKGVDRLNKDLEELQANIKKRVDAGGPASLPEDAANEAFIRHRDRSFTDKSGENEVKRLATAIRERLNLYDEETAKLSNEGAQYLLYGKVLDKTAEAIARVETATGKFAKASAADKAAIIAKAQIEDRAEAFRKESEAGAAAAKQREKDAQALTKLLADQAIATDVEVQKLQEDTKYLSLNTLERKIATEALKIEKQRRDELADTKNAGHEDEINANATKRTKEITAALTEADAVQKSFGFGAARAFAQYSEGAANAAKFTETFVTGSLSHMEDAIATFAETGKLSFKSLFTFMADEFIRNQIRMQISGAASGAAGGLGSLFGSFFGSNTGAATSVANALPGDSLDNLMSLTNAFGTAGGYANGLDYVPYDGFPAILHEGEKVLTRAAAKEQKSGNAQHFDFSGAHYSFGAGVDASTMTQAIRTSQAQTKAQIQRALTTGKTV